MGTRFRIHLPSAVSKFLEDEERSGNLLVGGAAVVGAVAFTAAVLAMLLMA